MDYGDVLSGTLALLRTIATDHRPAVLANAFGPESMVMTDLISKHDLDIEIVSIDTGRLPEETHALAHSVHRRYGPVVKMVSPDAAEVSAWTFDGITLVASKRPPSPASITATSTPRRASSW